VNDAPCYQNRHMPDLFSLFFRLHFCILNAEIKARFSLGGEDEPIQSSPVERPVQKFPAGLAGQFLMHAECRIGVFVAFLGR